MNLNKLNNPLLHTDSYKFSHFDQVPEGMEKMYSHLTPRHNKYLKRKFPNLPDKVIPFGIQLYLRKLNQKWSQYFFELPWEEVSENTLPVLLPHIGFTEEKMTRFKKLHALGYLPLKVKALPEGSHVNLNVPILTVTNTLPQFHWLPNFLEPDILNNIYKPTTVATLSLELAKLRNHYVAQTCPNTLNKNFMLHAFDFRGHPSGSCDSSGAAYTLFTEGTDTIVGIPAAQEYYDTKDAIAYSIPALEHSTATLGIQMYRNALTVYHNIKEEELTPEMDALAVLAKKLKVSVKTATAGYLACLSVLEYMVGKNSTQEQIELAVGETFNLVRLLIDVYPTGIFAYVADSYNYNRLISIILPAIKSVIKGRDGKIVIRPDSGDPVQIVTGISGVNMKDEVAKDVLKLPLNTLFYFEGKYYKVIRQPQLHSGMILPLFQLVASGFVQEVQVSETSNAFIPVLANEQKGSVETLWEIFGGTVNESGYKQLDSHIGLVYGDGMTFDRITSIYENLQQKQFAVDNVCLAAGAYMLSSVTRDDLGFAIKASYAEVNGIGVPVYKQPETDSSKASSKGLFKVVKDDKGEYSLVEDVSKEEEEKGELQVVFLDGQLKNQTTYEQIKARVNKLL